MFCTNCGAQVPDKGKFCPVCGTQLVSIEDVAEELKSLADVAGSGLVEKMNPAKESQSVEIVTNGEKATDRIAPPTPKKEESEPVPASLKAVIGKTADYYLAEFEKVEKGESTKFNWAAFLLGIFFCFYRKCGDLFKKYFLIPVVIMIASMVILSIASLTFSLTPMFIGGAVSFIGSLWMFVSYIRFGKNFNKEYYAHCKSVLAGGDKKKYGTSLGCAILILIIALLLACAPTIISIISFNSSLDDFDVTSYDDSNATPSYDKNLSPSDEKNNLSNNLDTPDTPAIPNSNTPATSKNMPNWCSGIYYGNDVYSTITFSDMLNNTSNGPFHIFIYRLVDIENCVCTEVIDKNKISFTGNFDLDVGSVSGVLSHEDNGDISLTITESDWDMLPVGTSMVFYYEFLGDYSYLDTGEDPYGISGVYASIDTPSSRVFVSGSSDMVTLEIMNRNNTIAVATLSYGYDIENINDILYFSTYTVGSEEELSGSFDPSSAVLEIQDNYTYGELSAYGIYGMFFKQSF